MDSAPPAMQFQEYSSTSPNGTNQPPFFIQISRRSHNVVLTDPVTEAVLYTICDTGRGTFSSKPDYEIFRPTPSDLFVGSVRITKKEIATKLPLTGARFNDTTVFNSAYLPESQGKNLHWRVVSKGRKTSASNTAQQSGATPQIALLECYVEGNEDAPICVLKLYDSVPNGRIEVWTKDACPDVGGDWNALDLLVTLAYANMEKVRRQMMRGIDSSTWSLGMVGSVGVIG